MKRRKILSRRREVGGGREKMRKESDACERKGTKKGKEGVKSI